jgi:hypothetical protein
MSIWDDIAASAQQVELLSAPLAPEQMFREARFAIYIASGTLVATLAILALTVILVLR